MNNPYRPPGNSAPLSKRGGWLGRRTLAAICCLGSLWILASGAQRFFWGDGQSLMLTFTRTQWFWFSIWVFVHASSAFGLALLALGVSRGRQLPIAWGLLFFCGACLAAWLCRMDFIGFNT